MELFERFETQLKADPKTIVFTEGPDARILSAASRLLAGGVLKVILLGKRRLKAALTSPAPRSSTPPATKALTKWSTRWSSCARAK